MSHSQALRLEVAAIVFVRFDDDGHVLHYLQPVSLQPDALHGVVRQEAYLAHSQVSQYLSPNAVVSLVGTEAQMYVGVHGVVAVLLQFVGGYFVPEPYAPSFLIEVDDHSLPFLFDETHGAVELFSAITTAASEDVARHATAVHTNEQGFIVLPRAHVDGHVFQPVALLAKGDDAEVTVLGGEVGLLATLDERLTLKSVGDEVTNTDELDAESKGL